MKLTPALQNYLLDLGLGVPETPNLDFVKQLQAKHLERYSFNNLAVLLGQSIPLDLQAISEKIVAQRLGGYCFEHNKLTYELLKSLGFNVQLKLARVLNNNFEREAARTHRVTLVTIDGDTYLVDTGFGGNGPIAPLQLNNASEQAGGLYRYRLFERENGEFDLQLVGGDSYFTLYRFDLADYNDADCEAGHLYSHKHPKAVFVNNLMVTLKKADQTVTLLNAELTVRDKQGEHKQLIETPDILVATLNSKFGLSLDPTDAESIFTRFLTPR